MKILTPQSHCIAVTKTLEKIFRHKRVTDILDSSDPRSVARPVYKRAAVCTLFLILRLESEADTTAPLNW